MKDDSLNDVSYCNTKEGIHETAKLKGLKPWSLGCSCDECNTEFSEVLNGDGLNDVQQSVGIRLEDEIALAAAYYHESVLHKEIWNRAIEAAALKADELSPFEYIVTAIRSLKK